jgi:tetratricopeptide (TPR) repeat protein
MYVTPALDNDLYAMLADVAAQQRDLAALRQYAPLAERLASRYDHVLYQAIAHRAWGVAHRLAGEYAEANVRLSQALELFQGLDTRWQIGRTLSELGELAAARAEALAARDYFSRALATFEDMKAAPDAARVRAVLAILN